MNIGGVMMVNALIQMLLVIDCELIFSHERTNQAFWNNRNPNEDLVFEFRVSNGFNDRLWRGKIRCVVATIIFKGEESERDR